MEVKRSSKAIQIHSPSTTISCSINGTFIKALRNPTIKASIMSEFLAETLSGNMPLAPANKLFTSPSRLIFECHRIATAVPFIIDKTEVHLNVHIYPIIKFYLLLGYSIEELIGSLDRESASAITC
jgi:hypothetical protein